MSKAPAAKSSEFSLASVPAFWPMAMAASLAEQGTALYARNLKFVEEESRFTMSCGRGWRHQIRCGSNCARCSFANTAGRAASRRWSMRRMPHTAMIADYHKGQSLIETLLASGVAHVALTDWKPAIDDMKDLEIDNYLAEVIVAIDDLGGRVNLIGLCQVAGSRRWRHRAFPTR